MTIVWIVLGAAFVYSMGFLTGLLLNRAEIKRIARAQQEFELQERGVQDAE